MTYKKWEEQLLKYLRPLPAEERNAAVEYYRELYEDKTEAGEFPESVLAEFGSPQDCAEKILKENGKDLPSVTAYAPSAVGAIIGMFFLSVLLVIPLFAAAFAVVAAFGAVTVAGAVSSIAGALYTVVSPIYLAIQGISFGGILAHMGMGIALAGVGALLFFAFLYITKYSFIYLIKGTLAIYKRRK